MHRHKEIVELYNGYPRRAKMMKVGNATILFLMRFISSTDSRAYESQLELVLGAGQFLQTS